MGLDGPLGLCNRLRERGGLDGAHDDAGVVVDDGVPGQTELDDVNAVAAIEARLNVATLHVDRISRQSTELPTVHHVVRNVVQ